MLYFVVFVLGASLGSFINVLAMRYDPRRSVFAWKSAGGRSRCDHCRRDLNWYEMIPVLSYLGLLGRCRICKARFSFRHILVELLSGSIAFFAAYHLTAYFGMGHALFNGALLSPTYYLFVLVWILVLATWLLIVLIDFRHYIIPDELNLTLLLLGLALIGLRQGFSPLFPMRESFLGSYSTLFGGPESALIVALLGALCGSVLFAALVFGSGGRAMGLGDVKLGFASGFVLGYPDMTLAITLSFLLGGLAGLSMLIVRKRRLGDALPFAPFLGLGFVLTFFFGYQILAGYFSVFPLPY